MTRRGRGLIVAGLLVMAVAAMGGVASVVVSERQADRFIGDFARAPAGCDTAIRFDRSATMDVWIETRGTLAEMDGSCPAPVEYDHGSASVPQILVTVTETADGANLRLGRTTTSGYDRNGFIGSRFRTVDVTEGLTVVVRVEAPAGDQIVVAFGPDPSEVGRSLKIIGITMALLGLVLGFAIFVAGLIRRFASPPTPHHLVVSGTSLAPPPPPTTPPLLPPPPPPAPSPPSQLEGPDRSQTP